ncbi:gluconokinase [Limnoraphis robusta]|uniref:Gluconokinase n=1 Tax=Limnoraphis robusta CS-951 TaxID=1637645 RepID=A0A0F5YKN6_9CYAN|nr:gluconokinase [Limnoraphis robusta]KKD39212.1 gluconate kinase [Limnoraphis robusta CS-951]MEA5496368.1 gluconokinase [Limnoraphis robusta BA-68 BA1]
MIILVMGVSGSGKTTIGQQLAKSLNFQFRDADEFHSDENIQKMRNNIPLTDADRQPWLETMQAAIDQWLEQNQNVVLTCSALKDKYRKMLWRDPEQIKIVYLKGTFELIESRLKQRQDHFMKSDLLKSQFEDLEEPEGVILADISQTPSEIIEKIRKAFIL